jgi:carbonic anhydrase
MSGKKMKKTNSKINVSRRNLIKLGAGAVGTGLVTVGLSSQKSNAASNDIVDAPELDSDLIAKKKSEATPDEALKMLIEGNKRFTSRKPKSPRQNFARLTEVAKKQKPFAAILGCADSRVPSEIVFDQGFGDLFVCRVAGNVATDEEVGSLEFGTLVLGSKVILVLGHERCGAVEATIKGASVPGKIGSILEAIRPAALETESVTKDRLEATIKGNVKLQVDNLKKSPVLAQLIQEKKLKIAGGYYDLDTGRVILVPEAA